MSKKSPQQTTLVFVRHGQTIWNAQGRWQGWLDSPLTNLGKQQARDAAEQLRDMHIDAAYSSDSGRAFETARIICRTHGIEPLAVLPLRERFYGGYEGLNSPEIEQQFPGSRFNASSDTRDDWRPPQGETMAEVRDRLRVFLKEMVPCHPGETVLCVTHSGVVRALDSLVSDRTFDEIWHRVPPNCCIFIVNAIEGRYEVDRDFFHEVEATA